MVFPDDWTEEQIAEHMATHKILTCPVCGFQTWIKADMDTHMATVHPDYKPPINIGAIIALAAFGGFALLLLLSALKRRGKG